MDVVDSEQGDEDEQRNTPDCPKRSLLTLTSAPGCCRTARTVTARWPP